MWYQISQYTYVEAAHSAPAGTRHWRAVGVCVLRSFLFLSTVVRLQAP